MKENITFMHPEFFWLLLLIPALVAWRSWKKKDWVATLTMSTMEGVIRAKTWRSTLLPGLFILRLLAICLLILAMARPRTVDISNQTRTTRGIDIVMAIDVSSSMLARDLKPNRLSALKQVAARFIENRPNDRIGLVLYAGEAFTRTPVTSDKAVLSAAVADIKYDRTLADGTAIGMGLATAINRLKDSKAKSKVVILLTDGVNNSGMIEPETASDIAKEFGIKVYTIGIGTNGMAEFPYAMAPNGAFIFRMMPVEIDQNLMKNIAQKTDGRYFRATSNSRLQEIYDEINKLETTEIEELRFYDYDEKYKPLLLAAIVLLFIEGLARLTMFRSFI